MIPNFNTIKKNLSSYDAQREKVIKKSRVVLKLSKQLIYTIHRKGQTTALYKQVQKEKKELDTIVKTQTKLAFENSYSEACQEYTEAITFLSFEKKGNIPNQKQVGVSPEDYLGGLADLTGELTRKAVNNAAKNPKIVKKIRDTIENIYGDFLQLDLPNGNLRKKTDAIKWNLKKVEEVVYDINT